MAPSFLRPIRNTHFPALNGPNQKRQNNPRIQISETRMHQETALVNVETSVFHGIQVSF